MKHHWKKASSLCMILVLVLITFAGCNTGSSAGGKDAKVKIMFSQPNTPLDNVDAIKNDPILKMIEEAVNIELALDSGFDGYPERVQTELISGTGADLFPNYGQQELTSKWIKDGVVTNIGEIINGDAERYPVLHKMINSPEYKMYNEFYSGEAEMTYAIYALTSVVSWQGAPLYNKELMGKAGFSKAPETVDEFVDFASKLGSQGVSGWWPRNNTLTVFNEIDKTIFAPNGTTMMAPDGDPWNGFLPVGGKDAIEGDWKLMTTSEQTKAAMKIMAKLYKNGGLDKGLGVKDDFSEAKSDFFTGQIGAFNHAFSSVAQVQGFIGDYLDANPNGSWDDMVLGTVLKGDAGMALTYSAPYWMGYNWFIPTSCKNPDRVLDLLEFLATDKGQDLIFKGVEGQHYTVEDGKTVYNMEEWKKQGSIYDMTDGRTKSVLFSYLFAGTQEQLALEKSDNWYKTSTSPLVVDTIPESELKTYINGVLDSYKDGIAGFMPPYFTIIQYSAELQEARVKMKEITLRYIPAFITGEKDIDAEWAAYVKEYEEAGALALEEHFNTAKDKAKEAFAALGA